MKNPDIRSESTLSRRSALALAGGVAGGLLAAGKPVIAAVGAEGASSDTDDLPVHHIQEILQGEGTVMNGVLTVELDRDDLHVVGPGGIPFKPSWEINSEFYFQPLGEHKAIFNGDICVLPTEANRVIDRILANGLTMMAFHQHFFDLRPMVFFIHFRGIGDPLKLARGAADVVSATGTPLPQTMPSHPKTPLDKDELAEILGGSAEVGSDGVVTVSIARKETIILDGVALKPETGVSTTVAFEPLDDEGEKAAVAPDFALIASEVNPVFSIMRKQGFQIHCLYNQETAESPQLYFSHQLAVGNALDLARKIRKGLNLTNSDFMS